MKNIFTFFLIFLFTGLIFSQSYQGPATGNLSSGIIQSTETLTKISPNVTPTVYQRPELQIPPCNIQFKNQSPSVSKYINDPGVSGIKTQDSDSLLSSWNGLNMTNYIPPDPTVAVGPKEVIAMVNTNLNIWDKEGNLLRSLTGDSWVAKSVSNAAVVTDPKIVYDHFAKRWIMVWMTVNTTTSTSYWVLSVSKDSSAIGTWYTWAMPSFMNGPDTTDNYSDYQGVGFDKNAIYICGNQFKFTGAFAYSKLRIIPKAQLFNNTPNAITWKDFWDIRRPGGSNQTFGIRPTIVFDDTESGYLVWGNQGGANFFSVFEVSNPLSETPTITGVNVPIAQFSMAPNANQLGGIKQYTIETSGSKLTNEAVLRNGKLYVAHSVLNLTDQTSSAVHYLKIDMGSLTAEEDVTYGAVGYWYYYPTIMADKDNNIALGFSRSGVDEYIGAYYASKKNEDATLGASKPLHEGAGNYEVTYSGTRNRWGDYMGIALDPVDEHSIWMHTEYASGTNKWSTGIGKLLVKPFAEPYISTQSTSLDFGNATLNGKGDTVTVKLTNLGATDLNISNIPSVGAFKVISNLTFPLAVNPYNSIEFQISFEPSSTDSLFETIPVMSNATNFTGINVKGFSFAQTAAELGVLYAVTGTNQNGEFHKLNTTTGVSSLIGPSTFTEIRSIAVEPKTKYVYGLYSSGTKTNLVSLNPVNGMAYKIFSVPMLDMKSMAFDLNGDLYFAEKTGKLYKIDVLTRKFTYVCSVKTNILSMAFNPKDNSLWGVANANLGIKDKIFKINTSTGDTVFVCRTGVGAVSNAITFDNEGKVYVVTGAATVTNSLYVVDTAASKSTLIGNTGIKNVTDITFALPLATSVNENKLELPKDYVLSQNYPNPFNPSTLIEYQLPEGANIKITVFNVLGEKIKELVNGYKEAGKYSVNWNASSTTSGIYFYQMKAVSTEGKEFTSIKKMILIK